MTDISTPSGLHDQTEQLNWRIVSAENIAAFVTRVRENPTLAAEVTVLKEQNSDGAVSGLVGLAAREGLPFTAEELRGMLQVGELADSDLQAVSGGVDTGVPLAWSLLAWTQKNP